VAASPPQFLSAREAGRPRPPALRAAQAHSGVGAWGYAGVRAVTGLLACLAGRVPLEGRS
jgi:hypothetical protein